MSHAMFVEIIAFQYQVSARCPPHCEFLVAVCCHAETGFILAKANVGGVCCEGGRCMLFVGRSQHNKLKPRSKVGMH